MNQEIFIVLMVAVFSAIIGSFLSVCIYRIPLKRFSEDTELQKMNLCFPRRSICTGCKKQLLWWHNIPILSWLILGGKCWFCKAGISVRYPSVELLTVICGLASLYRFGLTPTGILVFAFCAVMIVVAFIDIDYMIIPDIISIPGIWIGIAISALQHFVETPIFDVPVTQSLKDGGLGLLAGYGVFRLIAESYVWLRNKEGLGLGDVKLLGMIGAFFGLQCVLFTIFASSLLGSVAGIGGFLIFKRRFDQPMPFGPFIIFAALFFILGFNHSLYEIGLRF